MAVNKVPTSFNNLYGTAGTRLDDCSACHTSGFGFNACGSDVAGGIGRGIDNGSHYQGEPRGSLFSFESPTVI